MTAIEKKRLIKAIAVTLALIIIAVSAGLLTGYFGIRIPCIFNVITGLNCPGCGNTRAVLALLRLDFKAAFSVNAMFPVEFGYLLYLYIFLCFNYIKKGKPSFNSPSSFRWVDITVLMLILIWSIVRNIFGW